jgi:predicted enzyme related to lactoylglutathione lyase
MPNPVVSFEIRGKDAARLRTFYAEVFGWQIEVFPGGGYAGVETAAHTHEPDGTSRYIGPDAHMNDVLLGTAYGMPAWKFGGDTRWRGFEAGVSGGISEGGPGVTMYIQAPDLNGALDRAVAAGGKIVREPVEVAPNVVIAAFADPEGNEIGLVRRPSAPD